MRFVLTVLLFLLTWGLTILVALLFGEHGAMGLVFTFSFTAIAGWTLAPALEAIWEHFRRDAADDRNPASLTLWQRVGAAISSRDIAALWLAWIAVAFVVVVGGWLLDEF